MSFQFPLNSLQRFVVVTLFITAGCASAKTTAQQPSGKMRPTDAELAASNAVNNQAALAAEASFFTEVQFKTGSSELTEASRRAIQNVLTESAKVGKIDDVKILAWSDEELPSAQRKTLPQAARNLADQRGDAIANYIDTLSFKMDDVDTYNMAKRSNFLQRWAKTEDARFKTAMLKAGLPTVTDDRQYPSKASKAVILVTLED
ncbi:MAG: hypothetical protein KF767_03410 [Bdellovibrionaceae bacterium]|nr:hypothetical protein [Pseudobdellovibrionaceae bacterium]